MSKTIKLVRYNGNCENSYGSSPSSRLVLGKVYAVKRVQEFARHIGYELEGVTGIYNANWFDEVYDVSLAVSSIIPAADSIFTCSIINSRDGKFILEEQKIWVSKVLLFELNTYRVVDNHGKHYIVKVL